MWQKELWLAVLTCRDIEHQLQSLLVHPRFKKSNAQRWLRHKICTKSDTSWIHLLLDNHMWVRRSLTATILTINKTINVKKSFVAWHDFVRTANAKLS